MRRVLQSFFATIILIFFTLKIIIFLKDRFFPNLPVEGYIGVGVVGVIALVFYVENLVLKFRWIRSAKYGESLGDITGAFSHIHRLYRQTNNQPNEAQILEALILLCKNLAGAFRLITGNKCGVCIKIFTSREGDKKNYPLRTLCRDSIVGDRTVPDYVPNSHAIHVVRNNSDFETLLLDQKLGKRQYYMSNILPWISDYKNSSFEINGYPKGHDVK